MNTVSSKPKFYVLFFVQFHVIEEEIWPFWKLWKNSAAATPSCYCALTNWIIVISYSKSLVHEIMHGSIQQKSRSSYFKNSEKSHILIEFHQNLIHISLCQAQLNMKFHAIRCISFQSKLISKCLSYTDKQTLSKIRHIVFWTFWSM